VNVVVIGGGPLGLFYACQLQRAGATVAVMRRRVTRPTEVWRVVARFVGRSFQVELPMITELPPSVDVVVIAVRGEQLTPQLLSLALSSQARAVVCLTPALGKQLESWRARHPGLVSGMPAVAVEMHGETLGYWVAPSTLIERRGDNPALLEFVQTLRRAGVPTKWVPDAVSRTWANTVVLFPLHVAIFLQPEFRRWGSCPEHRLELAEAMVRARQLAQRLGSVEPALRFVAWVLSHPVRVRVAVQLQLWLAPRLTKFLEHHFGPKLGAQHAALQRDIQALADQHGLPSPIPRKWVEQLPSLDAGSGEHA
jgi:2-dehydropantoate 2-reductase